MNYTKTVWKDLPDTSTPITADKLNNLENGVEYLFEHGVGGDTLPIGIILPFTDEEIPTGYMLCDGSAISRTTYSDLFSIIGTTYGEGDGSTTFNLPNLKGRVPVGRDITDTDFDTLGETGGEKEHMHYNGMSAYNNQLTVSNTNSDSSHSADELYTITGTNGFNGVGTQNVYAYSTESGSSLQPYQVVNYIIKVSQTTSTQAQVVDGYSTSTTDSYSCNYVNSMNTYSTDEIRIGTWIDGKPIYRKVVARNITATNGTNILLSSLNIDELLKVKSINKKVSNDFTFYDNFFDSSDEKITLHYRNDIIEFWTATGTNYTSTVWIEYTKTTD